MIENLVNDTPKVPTSVTRQ